MKRLRSNQDPFTEAIWNFVVFSLQNLPCLQNLFVCPHHLLLGPSGLPVTNWNEIFWINFVSFFIFENFGSIGTMKLLLTVSHEMTTKANIY